MSNANEQFAEIQRKSLESAMQLAQLSIENSQRILEFQTSLAKTLFNDAVANAKELAATKDPQQAIALRTRYTQETAQKLAEAAQRIAALSQEGGTEFTHLLKEQLTSGSTGLMNSFQEYFKGLPGANNQFSDIMQQTLGSASAAFEQITQASTAAFDSISEAAKKAAKPKKQG